VFSAILPAAFLEMVNLLLWDGWIRADLILVRRTVDVDSSSNDVRIMFLPLFKVFDFRELFDTGGSRALWSRLLD
jgi:hypothetical protein